MLANQRSIYDQDARTISSVQGGSMLGEKAYTPDGRVYQYSSAGAVNLAAGLLNTSTSTTANHITQTGVATTVGSKSVTFTIGATAAAQDLYAGGYLAVTVGPGQNVYRITGNTSVSSAGGLITVTLDDPITVATTTASKFTLMPSPFKSTVVAPAAAATPVIGTNNVAVTAAFFYWSQVGGYAPVLNDATPITKNAGAIMSVATIGAATIEATTTVTQRIGYAPELTVAAAYWPINLTIAT